MCSYPDYVFVAAQDLLRMGPDLVLRAPSGTPTPQNRLIPQDIRPRLRE